MKSLPNFFNEYEYYITPSEMIEFLYCPRFTYFMKCLGIAQHEENRYKVQKGRSVHEDKAEQNKSYIRKKIGGVQKYIDVALTAPKLKIKGIVDEIYELEDGTMAPLDYKYAVYEEKDYKTYETQSIIYSLMIEEVYQVRVNRAFIVYCRNKQQLKEITVDELKRGQVIEFVQTYHKVLAGAFPKATRYKARCTDCCYRNICIKK